MAGQNGGRGPPRANASRPSSTPTWQGRSGPRSSEQFGVGRSDDLPRAPPERRAAVTAQRKTGSGVRGTALARLYELIQFQDQRIIELEALNGSTRTSCVVTASPSTGMRRGACEAEGQGG